MNNIKLYLIFCIFFVSSIFAIDTKQELIDWSIVGTAGAGAIFFSQTGPFFDEPFIDVRTSAPHIEDALSGIGFYSGSLAVSSAVFLYSDSRIESAKYRHFKGFVQSACLTSMLTGLSKDISGSPRPDADARYSQNIPKRHIRDSFPSGHASFAFCNATYSSMFIWNHWGERGERTALKALASGLLLSAATTVAYSRVENSQHRTADVIAGAVLGSATAFGTYLYQEKADGQTLSLEMITNGIAIAWRF